MKKINKDTQKNEGRFDRIRAQLLARPDLFARQGRVEASWRTCGAHRLGPYYRIVYREANRRKSIYLGRCPELAKQLQSLLTELQHPLRYRRQLRCLRRRTRASLRLELKKLAVHLAPLGYHLDGILIRRRRTVKKAVVLPQPEKTLPIPPAFLSSIEKAVLPHRAIERQKSILPIESASKTHKPLLYRRLPALGKPVLNCSPLLPSRKRPEEWLARMKNRGKNDKKHPKNSSLIRVAFSA